MHNKNESNVSRRAAPQKGGVLAGGLVLCSSAVSNTVLAETAPERETKSATVATAGPFTAVDEDGNPGAFGDPDTELYELPASGGGTEELDTGEVIMTTRLTAPGGRHITWGEWSQVSGSVTLECLNEGTRVMVHTSDLIDKGVYTIWVVVWDNNGVLVGAGPLGANDGSENAFRASESGEGHIVGIHEPTTMTLPPGNESEYEKCLLTDHPTVFIVGGYHNDDETHGAKAGPHEGDHFIAIF